MRRIEFLLLFYGIKKYCEQSPISASGIYEDFVCP